MEAFDAGSGEAAAAGPAALQLLGFVLERRRLDRPYEDNRGHCYTAELTFAALVGLLRDGLLVHGGTGHKGLVAAEEAGNMPVAQSSFHRKLSRMPVEAWQALLRECTARGGPPGEP